MHPSLPDECVHYRPVRLNSCPWIRLSPEYLDAQMELKVIQQLRLGSNFRAPGSPASPLRMCGARWSKGPRAFLLKPTSVEKVLASRREGAGLVKSCRLRAGTYAFKGLTYAGDNNLLTAFGGGGGGGGGGGTGGGTGGGGGSGSSTSGKPPLSNESLGIPTWLPLRRPQLLDLIVPADQQCDFGICGTPVPGFQRAETIALGPAIVGCGMTPCVNSARWEPIDPLELLYHSRQSVVPPLLVLADASVRR